MIRNDYILRLLEAFSQALTFFVTRLSDSGPEAALESADELLVHHFGVGTQTFLDMPDEEVYSFLRLRDETATEEKIAFVAAMLHQTADVLWENGDEEAAYERWLHALHLVLHILKVDPEFDMPTFTPTIDTLYERLTPFILPPLTYVQVIATHVQRGEYGHAEDALIDWVDADENDLEPVVSGIDLYQQFLLLSDARLEEGGLSRAECEEGLAALQEIMDEEG